MHLFKIFRFLILFLLITTGCNKPNNLEMFRNIFKKNTNLSTPGVKPTKSQNINETQVDCSVQNEGEETKKSANRLTVLEGLKCNALSNRNQQSNTTQPLNHTNESNTTDSSTKTNEQLQADLDVELAELEKIIKELESYK